MLCNFFIAPDLQIEEAVRSSGSRAFQVLMADVKVDKKKEKQEAPQIPAIPMVSLWALVNAVLVFASCTLGQHNITLVILVFGCSTWQAIDRSRAKTLIPPVLFLSSCMQPPWLTQATTEPTGAAVAEVGAIRHRVVLSAAAQAAPAAVALLLLLLLLPADSCRRSRLALAHVALVATAATHLMLARAVTLFLATDPPGGILWWAVGAVDIVMFAAGDIICFRALLVHG